jgi:quinoprotein glucose dehydrogenase
MRALSRSLTVLLSVGAMLIAAPRTARAQQGAKSGEWPTYGGDLGNTRYSALDQITADNFSKLEIAWRFKTDALGPRPEFNLESTPLMVNGRLFSTAGTRRAVVALDAATGEMLWMHSENEGARGAAAPTLRTRVGVLDGRQRRTDSLRHAWLPDDRARREDRYHDFEFRRKRRRRSETE